MSPEERASAGDPLAAVLEIVQSDWRSFGLPAATVVTAPRDQTLVGAATRLSTDAPLRATLPPKTILGYSVTLTVTATTYAWDFGDGSTLVLPASEAHRAVEHVYRVAGDVTVSLRTIYTATFSVAGTALVDEPLQGTADVPGPPTTLNAAEARTQLEAGPTG